MHNAYGEFQLKFVCLIDGFDPGNGKFIVNKQMICNIFCPRRFNRLLQALQVV